MILKYLVKKENVTINYILKNELQISSRLFNKLIKNNLVFLNNKQCDTRIIPKYGDLISINFNYDEDNSNIVSTNLNLHIIYEDEWLLILNKPSNIAIHPSRLHYDNTLSNGVKYYFDTLNLHKKIRPVNRLDFDTKGLVIFAKNEYIQECLIKQMEKNLFKKEYLALVEGHLAIKKGTIDKPIARKEESIIMRTISKNGKKSITHFQVIEEFRNCSLINCQLETGRTHQIRVHFSSIGHPLIGDTLYGNKNFLCNGQVLICYKLSFIHPITKKDFTIELEKKDINFPPFDLI